MEQMPGQFKFKVDGNSWMTQDIRNFNEFKDKWEKSLEFFYPQSARHYFDQVLEVFGIDPKVIELMWLKPAVNVETSVNITVEIWNEGMSAPSMSFNLLFNMVLVDISYDKIPDAVFEAPAGFEIKTLNPSTFQDLMKFD
jgi:hypothetical protein